MSTDLRFLPPTAPSVPEPPQRRHQQRGKRRAARNLRLAAEGAARWTRRPYGYDREGTSVSIVPEEAEALRWAVQELLGGATLGSVARRLNDEGRRTTAGGEWTASNLRRAVLNPRLAGEQAYRGQVIGRGDWEAILEVAVQERLRELLGEPGRRVTTGNEARYLLSGIARCGICSGMLLTMGRQGVYICRDGNGHLSRKSEAVDAYVSSVVPVLLARAAETSRPDSDAADADQLAEVRQRRAAIAKLVADGLLPEAEARENAERLTARIRELELRLATPPRRRFFGRVADAQRRWDSLPLEEQRRLIVDNLVITIKPIGRGVKAEPEQYVGIALKSPGR